LLIWWYFCFKSHADKEEGDVVDDDDDEDEDEDEYEDPDEDDN